MIENFYIRKYFYGDEISSLISELLELKPCVDRKDLYVWNTNEFSLVLEINPVYVISQNIETPLKERLNYIWSLECFKNGVMVDRVTHNLFNKYGMYDEEFIREHMNTIMIITA